MPKETVTPGELPLLTSPSSSPSPSLPLPLPVPHPSSLPSLPPNLELPPTHRTQSARALSLDPIRHAVLPTRQPASTSAYIPTPTKATSSPYEKNDRISQQLRARGESAEFKKEKKEEKKGRRGPYGADNRPPETCSSDMSRRTARDRCHTRRPRGRPSAMMRLRSRF